LAPATRPRYSRAMCGRVRCSGPADDSTRGGKDCASDRFGELRFMTLLLTECSIAGIVMAADSATTMIDGKGRSAKSISLDGLKVLRAPKVCAAVGYWGFVGKIFRGRFDDWVRRQIDHAMYSDLPSLAIALAEALNTACRNRPLADNECAGLHIAGFHNWEDGERRPFFFRVHNGPGYVQTEHLVQPLQQGERLIEVRPRLIAGPRTLFEPHQDFPPLNSSLQENLELLRVVYTTRNGDLFYYSGVWDALQRSFNYLNLIPNFSIPRNDSLEARRGLLIAALETTVRVLEVRSFQSLSARMVTCELARNATRAKKEHIRVVCGRGRLSSDVSEIKMMFSIPHRPTPNFAPSWNVAPTDPLPVVRFDAKAGERSRMCCGGAGAVLGQRPHGRFREYQCEG
jgi:hypothetical protein